MHILSLPPLTRVAKLFNFSIPNQDRCAILSIFNSGTAPYYKLRFCIPRKSHNGSAGRDVG